MKRCIVIGSCLFVAAANSQTKAQLLTLSIEQIPGQFVNGGSNVFVEVFITNNGPEFAIQGVQIDLPCNLPGKPGSSGTAMTVGPLAVSVNTASAAASGSIPWVFAVFPPNDAVMGCGGFGCAGGLRPINQAACRFAGTPGPGEPLYLFPTGAKRYVGTVRYTLSLCATGAFNIPFELMNMPCQPTDLTRIDGAGPMCQNFNPVAGAILVATGQCCVPPCNCVADGINETCCVTTFPGASWTSWNTCDDSCGCISDSECLSNFCEPRYCTPQGCCVPAPPPSCPDSECTIGVCNPAFNGGAGGCVNTPRPSGTPCGNPAGSPCDNPDTCVAGTCAQNHRPDGTPCPDQSACTTLEQCEAGQCVLAEVDCDDELFCNGNETCDPATGCVDGSPPCSPDEICNEAQDLCETGEIPTVTAWGMAVLLLALLISSKLWFGSRGEHQAEA